MTFNEIYKIEERAQGTFVLSKYSEYAAQYNAGVYSFGLLTLVNDFYEKKIDLKPWKQLYQNNYVPFAFTAFGNLFLFNIKNKLVSLFEPQFSRLTEIEIDLKEFFEGFLSNNGIINDLIKKDYVSQVLNFNEQLSYGECYILQPWSLLGGNDEPENYEKGDFATYFDLVSQAYH